MIEVKIECMKKVLDGDLRYLGQAFSWSKTPEGYNYWYFRASRAENFTVEDLCKCMRMLEDYCDRRIPG